MPSLVDIQIDEWSEPLFVVLDAVCEVDIFGPKLGFGEQAFKIAIRESAEVGDHAHADWSQRVATPYSDGRTAFIGILKTQYQRLPEERRRRTRVRSTTISYGSR